MKFFSVVIVLVGFLVLLFSEVSMACCVCMLCNVDTQIHKQEVAGEKICQDQAGKLTQEVIQP